MIFGFLCIVGLHIGVWYRLFHVTAVLQPGKDGIWYLSSRCPQWPLTMTTKVISSLTKTSSHPVTVPTKPFCAHPKSLKKLLRCLTAQLTSYSNSHSSRQAVMPSCAASSNRTLLCIDIFSLQAWVASLLSWSCDVITLLVIYRCQILTGWSRSSQSPEQIELTETIKGELLFQRLRT